MKHELLEIKKVFETAPFTYSTIAPIMAEVKSEHMMWISSPIFLFHGYRGNGKTSVVKAGLENMDNIFKFADDYKEVKKQMGNIPCNEVVLLDNYPQYISNAGKQEGKRKLEKFTDLASERQDYPLLVMTAENYIFDDLTDSLRTRILEVEVTKLEENTELVELRDLLFDNREYYLEILKEFRIWNQTREKNSKEEFENFCKRKRNEYPEASQRTHGMIFLYSYAYDKLDAFLAEKFNVGLEQKQRNENIDYLYKKKQMNCENENSLITELLNRILEKPAFLIKRPVTTTRCQRYFKGSETCVECEYWVYDACDTCCGNSEYYEPISLLLEEEYNSAILLDSPRKIFQYPVYLEDDGPVLIVRGATLLKFINMELKIYCNENKIILPSYGVKQINKELFAKSHIYYNYHGGEHKTYLFNYRSCIRSNFGEIEKLHKESVLFIKLSSQQYKNLLKHEQINTRYETNREFRHIFIQDLIKFGDRVCSFLGNEK